MKYLRLLTCCCFAAAIPATAQVTKNFDVSTENTRSVAKRPDCNVQHLTGLVRCWSDGKKKALDSRRRPVSRSRWERFRIPPDKMRPASTS